MIRYTDTEFFNAQNYEEKRTMPPMIPASRPQLTKEDALRKLSTWDVKKYPVKILGVRGYFKKTLGNPTKNDIGVYDDALFIISDGFFKSYNANTDPSRMNSSMAVLKPGGPYLYKIGMHGVSGPHPYEALRQYGNVTVLRGGKVEVTDSPANRFYIDIHRGGYTITSSLGCQTIHPDQWPEFLRAVKEQLTKYNQTLIPYILIEG